MSAEVKVSSDIRSAIVMVQSSFGATFIDRQTYPSEDGGLRIKQAVRGMEVFS
jgi:hypothetical protein